MANMTDVLGLILGGGRGTRLYPLTDKRAKPAVPLAGKYRLIDIPLSNCIHAGIHKIAVLTQFKSVSLHRHILRTYHRDMFTKGWVEILAAEQTGERPDWYQGTADAVRQQWVEIKNAHTKYVLILAGDHLYDMDYGDFVNYHESTGADITLAVQPVSAAEAPGFGILKRDENGQIVRFTEKPPANALGDLASMPDSDKPYMASMGIYVFSSELLHALLQESGDDFGKDIIPAALDKYHVMGYVYDGYWTDIGTIRRFYEVNLELTMDNPPFNIFDSHRLMFTRPRFLPPSEIRKTLIDEVLLADGCHIHHSDISHSIIGLRSIIGPDVTIRSSVLMGADYYEDAAEKAHNAKIGRPDVGIASGSIIENAIIDKNARIGRNVHIRNLPDRPDEDSENWVSREGLVIVPKSAVIPDNSVI